MMKWIWKLFMIILIDYSISIRKKNLVFKSFLILILSLAFSINSSGFDFKKKITRDTLLASKLQYKADSLYSIDKFNQAASNYFLAAVLYEKHKIWKESAHNYSRTGLMQIRQEEFDSALINLNYAKSLAEEYLDTALKTHKVDFFEIYYFFGHYYYYQYDFNSAVRNYFIALEFIKDAIPADSLIFSRKVFCYKSISNSYFYKHDNKLALEYAFKALNSKICITGIDHIDLSSYYYNIATIYKNKKDYIKSIEYYEKTIDVIKSFSPEPSYRLKATYNNLAKVFYELKQYDKSLENFINQYNVALKLYEENTEGIAFALNNLGMVQIATGDYDNAFQNINKSIEIREKEFGKRNYNYAYSINTLASYYESIGNSDKAIENYLEAVSVFEEYDNYKSVEIAENYNKIGLIYLHKKQFNVSLDYFKKAMLADLKGADDLPGFSNPNVFIINKNRLVLNDSILILSKPLLFSILSNKANVLYQKFNENRSDTELLKTSFAAYELAINLMEMIRKEMSVEDSKYMLSSDVKSIYSDMMEIAFELYKIFPNDNYEELIYRICEKSKSSVLKDQINESIILKKADIPDELAERKRSLSLDINFYKTQLQKIKFSANSIKTDKIKERLEDLYFNANYEYDTLLNFIEMQYPKINKYDEIYNYSLKSIQSNIKANDVILDYFVGNENIYIISISDKNCKILTSPIDSAFEITVQNYSESIKKYQKDNFIINSGILYNKLIKPVEESIQDKEKLIIIPNDYLYYIPYETLFDNTLLDKKNTDYSEINYLVKSYEISYYHSVEMWCENIHEIKDKDELVSGFIGFAPIFVDNAEVNYSNTDQHKTVDAIYINENLRTATIDGKRFVSLPYSKEEVVGIYRLFEKNNFDAQIFLNKDANEENFKSKISGNKFVHVSTHGFSNDNAPELSGLAFWNNSTKSSLGDYNENDGILYSNEMYNLSINAELVVLSSCESGIGQLIAGEGLMAMTRGFLYNGVPNILFSLWKVSDKQTCDFMLDFYKNILDEKSYSEALRMTKIKMINNPQTAIPRIWSSFVLLGL